MTRKMEDGMETRLYMWVYISPNLKTLHGGLYRGLYNGRL